MLLDSGYHFTLPDELLPRISGNNKLLVKPIVVTFDDGTLGQITNAFPVLEAAGIKAGFFIKTVVLTFKDR